jgi:hypothetical protein
MSVTGETSLDEVLAVLRLLVLPPLPILQDLYLILAGNLAAFVFEEQHSKQVIYRTADNHIHELFVTLGGPPWSDADLTHIARAPAAPQTTRM